MTRMRWVRIAGFMAVGLVTAMLLAWPAASSASGSTSSGVTWPSGPQITVGPERQTRVPVVWDCTGGGGPGGTCDMAGAVAGRIGYSQGADGSLDVEVLLNFAYPDTKYTAYLTCGPSHDTGCGYRSIGVVRTGGDGRGHASLSVPVAKLQSYPFGAGYRTDHIDLLPDAGSGSSGFFAAGAINYYVPRGSGVSSGPRGGGDPLD